MEQKPFKPGDKVRRLEDDPDRNLVVIGGIYEIISDSAYNRIEIALNGVQVGKDWWLRERFELVVESEPVYNIY